MSQDRHDARNESLVSSDQSTIRPKQRSMLPQPGTPRSTIRPTVPLNDSSNHNDSIPAVASKVGAPKPVPTTSISRGTAVTGSKLGRPRPRSLYQTESVPARKDVEASNPPTAQSMRPPSLMSKPSTTPSLGVTRSQSLRRPAVTSQNAASTSTVTYPRTQSTSTVPLARSNTTRPRTTTERPKSLHISSTPLLQSSNETTQAESSTARATTRLAGLSRSASVRTRPEGTGGSVRPPATTRSNESAVGQSNTKDLAKNDPKKVARPAFSTLQQHFTPRKAAKAPTSTFLHPAPVTTGNSLPTELVSLQIDLLQLHLLHKNAAEVSKQWEMSAKRALRSRFDEVSSMYQLMLQHERSGQEQKNLQALLDWTKDKSSASLVEHIQILSGPLHELPSLVQTGGRFQRHVGTFERWLTWIEEIRAARHNQAEAGLGSVEGLGDAWQAENAALMRKLSSFARELNSLAQPAAGSSIMAIVDCCQTLLDGLLEELRVMQTIESDVVSHEKEWVETRLQGIAADIGCFLVDETPAWRM